jgi:hypothetical protein
MSFAKRDLGTRNGNGPETGGGVKILAARIVLINKVFGPWPIGHWA